MAAVPAPLRSRRLPGDDRELVARIRRGDELAFAAVHARYRAALERYAMRMLGSSAAAEDAVQDAFVRAHQALLRDEREIELRPWLYRLVRNRCLDELKARPRVVGAVGGVALDEVGDAAAAEVAPLADPVAATERRHALREVVADIAALPERQREVLLRRELDGQSHEELAAELGITVPASKKLANRARENLVKASEARNESCAAVRRDLLRAHDGRRRASAHAYRHVAVCSECRRYRSALGATRTGLRIFSPLPLAGALLAAVKGAAASALPGAGSKAVAATALTAAAVGGAYGVAHVTLPGAPSPATVRSAVFFGGVVYAGDRMPPGTALVRKTVRVRAQTPDVALRCPSGMRVAGMLPHAGANVGHGFAPSTVVGSSGVARVVFSPAPRGATAAGATDITVGTVCKRPNAAGSILAAPVFFSAATRVHRVCARRSYLYETPDGLVVGTVFRGQPVTRLERTANKRWWRIKTDAGVRGWVRASALC